MPPPGKLNLDHVAHFVPDMDEAARDFAKLGFTLTPFSAQAHRLEPDGPLVPAGTANRCVNGVAEGKAARGSKSRCNRRRYLGG